MTIRPRLLATCLALAAALAVAPSADAADPTPAPAPATQQITEADLPPIVGRARVVADGDVMMIPMRAGCTMGNRAGTDDYGYEGWNHNWSVRVFWNRCAAATVVESVVAKDTVGGSRSGHHCRSILPPGAVDKITMNVGNLDGWNPGPADFVCHEEDLTYRKVWEPNGVIIDGTTDNKVAMDWKVEWRPGSDATGTTTTVTVPNP